MVLLQEDQIAPSGSYLNINVPDTKTCSNRLSRKKMLEEYIDATRGEIPLPTE